MSHKTHHHFTDAVRFSPRGIKQAVSEVQGLNAKLAVLVTNGVGSMLCAWCFTVIALISLPAILIQANVLGKHDVPTFFTKPGLIVMVAWVAQTFIQLVLLSIIMVGQRVQAAASDVRATKQFSDVEQILDRLDEHTQGGIKTVLDAINARK